MCMNILRTDRALSPPRVLYIQRDESSQLTNSPTTPQPAASVTTPPSINNHPFSQPSTPSSTNFPGAMSTLISA